MTIFPHPHIACYNLLMHPTHIQLEIQKAILQLSEKTSYTEFILAKKIRENINLTGKKKAGIALADLEAAISLLEQTSDLHFSLHVNSANDILIEKTSESVPLTAEARKRRLASEKSMSVFSNGDVSQNNSKDKKSANKKSPGKIKRTSSQKINVNSNFEEWE